MTSRACTLPLQHQKLTNSAEVVPVLTLIQSRTCQLDALLNINHKHNEQTNKNITCGILIHSHTVMTSATFMKDLQPSQETPASILPPPPPPPGPHMRWATSTHLLSSLHSPTQPFLNHNPLQPPDCPKRTIKPAATAPDMLQIAGTNHILHITSLTNPKQLLQLSSYP